jgi:hypothetical protein
MRHAWVTAPTGEVIDLTWPYPDRCTYFGVPFVSDDLRQLADAGWLGEGLLEWAVQQRQLVQANGTVSGRREKGKADMQLITLLEVAERAGVDKMVVLHHKWDNDVRPVIRSPRAQYKYNADDFAPLLRQSVSA